MAGLNISCGTFYGDDKSGSAFEGVLDALSDAPAELVRSIKEGFDGGDHVLISEKQAASLLPLLVEYRARLVNEMGHEDWASEVAAEEAAELDPTGGKWAASRGWRLYCTTNLIRACQTSAVEHEPIAIVGF